VDQHYNLTAATLIMFFNLFSLMDKCIHIKRYTYTVWKLLLYQRRYGQSAPNPYW